MAGTILITGGAGYVGSHATLALEQAGYSTVILDDLSTGSRMCVPKGTELVVGNLGDRRLVMEVLKQYDVGAVMHFGASTVVPESVAEPLAYYRNNTVNTLVLLESCIEAGIERFVFSSTAAVYGIPDRLPVAESSPTLPINPYGSSKMMAETMLRDAAAAHGLRYVILRYFNVAGADPQLRSGQSGTKATHLIKVASQVAVGSRPALTVHGLDYPTPDGTCVRDYIHVSDLAEAHVLALQRLDERNCGLLLNAGYGRGYSVREVISAIERMTGKELSASPGPRRPGDPPALYASSDRIRNELGWKPKHDDLDFIVSTAVDWERRLAGNVSRSV